MSMNPSVELKAAAAKLRPSSPAIAKHTVAVRLHPAVVDALADWLDAVATDAERHAAQGWGNDESEITDGPPIAVARAINGGLS